MWDLMMVHQFVHRAIHHSKKSLKIERWLKNYLLSRTIDRRIAGIKIVTPVLLPAIGSLQEDLKNRQHCSISQHQSVLIFWSQNNLCAQLLNKSPLCVTSEIKVLQASQVNTDICVMGDVTPQTDSSKYWSPEDCVSMVCWPVCFTEHFSNRKGHHCKCTDFWTCSSTESSLNTTVQSGIEG